MASSQQAQASSSSITAAAVEDKRSFSSLGVPVSLVRALAALSIVTPTPIQRESLPSILSGLDLIAGSPTGSGKTLSFALPILTQLSRDMVAGFAVVLTPTRELAAQLHEQFVAVAEGANMGVRTALVLGGEDMMSQARVLAERPNVVVATPGRLADLLTSNGEHEALRRCRYVVLDEADRLLTPTFAEPLAAIFAALPPAASRQTLLFSATLTPQIEALAERPREKGERQVRVCRIEGDTTTPPQLKQHYIFIPSHIREPFLYHLLLNPPHQPPLSESGSEDDEEDYLSALVPTIIFTSRCRTAALLSRMLTELGLPNVALHSYLPQSARTANLNTFRAARSPILITTDVGSRGLDVPEVRMVVNWDIPRDWRDYVHRVGRTARAGREGTAISFVGERDVELLKEIEENIGVQMTEHTMPEETVLEKLNAVSTAKRVATMALHDSKFGQAQERNKQKAQAEVARSGEAKKAKKAKGKREKRREESSA